MSKDFIPQHRQIIQHECSCIFIYILASLFWLHSQSLSGDYEETDPLTLNVLVLRWTSFTRRFQTNIVIQNNRAILTFRCPVCVTLLIPQTLCWGCQQSRQFWEEDFGMRPLNSFNWGHQKTVLIIPKPAENNSHRCQQKLQVNSGAQKWS